MVFGVQSFEEKPVSVGPWGGNGGYRWDDGVYSTVRQLVIVHGDCKRLTTK